MEDIKSPAMADLAELIGIEAMMKIVEMWPAARCCTFPKMESVLASIRDRHPGRVRRNERTQARDSLQRQRQLGAPSVVNEKQLFGQMNMFD